MHLNLFVKKYVVIEPQITENLRQLINRTDTVWDIGANIGYYTILFSKWASKVIAVEPDLENAKWIKKNIKYNQLKNVRVVQEAVSDMVGKAVLFKDEATGRSSSLNSNSWHPNWATITESIVPTLTLDNLLINFGPPDVIKCDVEGHEDKVLLGATNTLSYKPIWMLEVKKHNREFVSKALAEQGYCIFNAKSPLPNQSPNVDIINHNVIAIHESRF